MPGQLVGHLLRERPDLPAHVAPLLVVAGGGESCGTFVP